MYVGEIVKERGKNCPCRGNTYKIQLFLQKGALRLKEGYVEKPLKNKIPILIRLNDGATFWELSKL
jgi:hypothetical protein